MIPFCQPDLPRYADAVRDSVRANLVGPGEVVDQFENILRTFTGAKHVIATTSGTMALWLAARAFRLERSAKEIWLPGYGIAATANAVVEAVGGSVRLIDVDRDGSMSWPALLSMLEQRNPDLICYVDFAGLVGRHLPELRQICDRRGIRLLEDAACGLGHSLGGKHAGTFGHIGCLSFSIPKLVTTGQGGAILTDDADYAKFIRGLIYHGDAARNGDTLSPGLNLRMTDMQATLGIAQMARFSDIMKQKRIVHAMLTDDPMPASGPPLFNIVHHSKPMSLIAELKGRGIEARTQYRALRSYTAYKNLTDDIPESRTWESTAVYLPFGASLTMDDATAIRTALSASRKGLIA